MQPHSQSWFETVHRGVKIIFCLADVIAVAKVIVKLVVSVNCLNLLMSAGDTIISILLSVINTNK